MALDVFSASCLIASPFSSFVRASAAPRRQYSRPVITDQRFCGSLRDLPSAHIARSRSTRRLLVCSRSDADV